MRRYRPLAVLTAIVAATGLALVATAWKAEQNADRRARFHERDLRLNAADELGEEVTTKLSMALFSGVPFDEFRRAFRPPAELREVTDPKYPGMTHSLTIEKSRQVFYLRFEDGRLMGFQGGDQIGPMDAGVVLETPAFLASETVRGMVLSAGLVTWGAALVVGLCSLRLRRTAAVVLVVTSMLCGLCWFLTPNYDPAWRGISSNDNLAYFAFMLIASLGIGATATSRGGPAGAMDDAGHVPTH